MRLEKFLGKYGTNTTSIFDLNNIKRDLGLNDLSIIMSDELKSKSSGSGSGNTSRNTCKSYIMNYQTTRERGSHWVLVSKLYKIYFDSYGIVPPDNVFEYLGDFTYNTMQVQPEGTSMCGQLCLYVYYKLMKGYQFEDIVLEMYEVVSDSLNTTKI